MFPKIGSPVQQIIRLSTLSIRMLRTRPWHRRVHGVKKYATQHSAVIAMLAVIFFHAVTLPVEFDASNRALKQMEALHIVDDMEITGAKKVLRAAAMTYLAALATAIANLLRLFAMRGNRN